MSDTPDTPTTSMNWKEGRRRRAWELHQLGWTQQAIATALGCAQSSVSGWIRRAAAAGVDALRHRPPPGPTPLLAPTPLAQLPALLAQGAAAFGWRGEYWTTRRVAKLIGDEFGVYYHPAPVSRLLRQIGWSCQKPITRAAQRDAKAVAAWAKERRPAIQKKLWRKGAPSSG
jgi:transposase